MDPRCPELGPSLRLTAEALSLPLDSIEATGEVAVAARTVEIAAGTIGAGTVAAQRMTVTGARRGRPLITFMANWYCTADLDPAWDLGATGWRVTVAGDAPLRVDLTFDFPLEAMGQYTPGYTANRAVNAVAVVCGAAGHPDHRGPAAGRRHPRRRDAVRPLPELTPASGWFWTSGADGQLRIQRCTACQALVHPPVPICPVCRSRDREPSVVSGRGTVIGYTVNQHRWHPDLEPPYAVAVVALAEDPSVRLTTMLVDCDPDDVSIGQEVAVRFEHLEDVWLPCSHPPAGAPPTTRWPIPCAPARLPLGDDRFEHRSVLSGVGRWALGRRLLVDPLSLTVDACLEAVADAGLSLEDIDGLSTYPARPAWA